MSDIQKPIAILGAGPVGSILAAAYCSQGQDVVMVETLDSRRTVLQRDGIRVAGTRTFAAQPRQVVGSIEELKGRPLAALFICTKTWTLKTVLPQLPQFLDPETVVVSFQNGIGPEDMVARHWPRERVARGIVNYAGGVSEDNGQVTMQWFTPPNYLGALDDACKPRIEPLSRALVAAGLETEIVPCQLMKQQAFWKTILNSALNALCANAGITMRQAMTFKHTRSLARMLMREGLSVASALGYHYGEHSLQDALAYLDRGGDHLPSMWMDLQRGSLTEIEFINGKIAEIGLMFRNVDVDANLFFTSLIITQEIKSGARRADDIPEYLTMNS